jgi:hypothetical protein
MAIESQRDSVVNIHGQKLVGGDDGTEGETRRVNGMGTGVVIDPRGYAVTNYHVVEGVRRIEVTLASGKTTAATLVSHDPRTDLAVIKIASESHLPVATIGTSSDLMIGETVLALGNAYGYEHTVTRGIISALHRNVEVTDVAAPPRRLVSQAFCSALPLGYSRLDRSQWEPFARLILEATYEATLLAAAEQAQAGGSNIVLLTRVGGGVFNNDAAWIDAAIERAARIVEHAGLDIRVVCPRKVSPGVRELIEKWG